MLLELAEFEMEDETEGEIEVAREWGVDLFVVG